MLLLQDALNLLKSVAIYIFFGKNQQFIKTDFGFKVSLRVMVSPTFFAWVMGFGDEIKILEPTSLRKEMREILSKTAALYPEAE